MLVTVDLAVIEADVLKDVVAVELREMLAELDTLDDAEEVMLTVAVRDAVLLWLVETVEAAVVCCVEEPVLDIVDETVWLPVAETEEVPVLVRVVVAEDVWVALAVIDTVEVPVEVAVEEPVVPATSQP